MSTPPQRVCGSHLARGAIPLAFPNSYPCNLTGIPLFPAAIAAVWLNYIHNQLNPSKSFAARKWKQEERVKTRHTKQKFPNLLTVEQRRKMFCDVHKDTHSILLKAT